MRAHQHEFVICFQCGESHRQGKRFTKTIDGIPRYLCCLGCLSAADLIESVKQQAQSTTRYVR